MKILEVVFLVKVWHVVRNFSLVLIAENKNMFIWPTFTLTDLTCQNVMGTAKYKQTVNFHRSFALRKGRL